MTFSGFNKGQSGNATEVGAGVVKLATQQQVDDGAADDGGVPLVATPDKLGAGKVLTEGTVYGTIDASVSPKAVSYNPTFDSIQLVTNAALSPSFAGFVTNGLNNVAPTPGLIYQSTQLSGDTPTQIIIPAATDVGMMVHCNGTGAGSASPSSVTYGGVPLIKVLDEFSATDSGSSTSAWFLALGDLPSGQTADLVITGLTGSTMRLVSVGVYNNLKQATPTLTTYNTLVGTSITDTATVSNVGILSQFITCVQFNSNVRITTSGNVVITDGNLSYAAYNLTAVGDTSFAIAGANDTSLSLYLSSVFLEAAVGPTVAVQIAGSVGGFTGLTPQERYFVDVNGDVTLTPGGQFVGWATSASKIQLKSSASATARSYATGNTALSSLAAVVFAGLSFDTDGFWSGENPTRLTIPVGGAGRYLVGAGFQLSNANPGTIALRLNGTTYIALSGYQGYSGTFSGGQISNIIDLEDGDYIECVGQVGSASAIAGQGTSLWLQKIG